MLELKHSSEFFYTNCTIFPRSLVYIKSIDNQKALYLNQTFLQSSLKDKLCIIPKSDFLNSKLTIKQNLEIISTFIKVPFAPDVIFPYFNLDHEILSKKPSHLTKEEKIIIITLFFLLKDSKVFVLNLDDISLSCERKDKLQNMISSKASNSNSIIFYSTSSGCPLEASNQIILSSFDNSTTTR